MIEEKFSSYIRFLRLTILLANFKTWIYRQVWRLDYIHLEEEKSIEKTKWKCFENASPLKMVINEETMKISLLVREERKLLLLLLLLLEWGSPSETGEHRKTNLGAILPCFGWLVRGAISDGVNNVAARSGGGCCANARRVMMIVRVCLVVVVVVVVSHRLGWSNGRNFGQWLNEAHERVRIVARARRLLIDHRQQSSVHVVGGGGGGGPFNVPGQRGRARAHDSISRFRPRNVVTRHGEILANRLFLLLRDRVARGQLLLLLLPVVLAQQSVSASEAVATRLWPWWLRLVRVNERCL